ncbi:GntR family transcriptional regulator [Marihabitans asiaticum]|uniref:GntR family transcriptional regulator n=1 Tax=Marihabitans asiaticum TaxID=415218 RepID=UPI00319DC964
MPRSLLRDEVFTRLRDAITDGSLTPGEQLRDLDLAQQLGVSRTPVREALLRLAEVGLVIARPGSSTTVSPLEVKAVQDARDVVAAMHETAVRVAVDRLTEADLAEMSEANARFEAALRDGDLEAALAADDDLHAVPVRAANNDAVAAVLDQYSPVLRRAERLRFSTLTGGGSVARHAELIKLCRSGDSYGAAANAFDTFHSLPAARGTTDPSVNED